MKRIMTVVGARPQFIKAAPLSLAIKGCFDEVLVHTGQHYDLEMSEVFFKEFNIKSPDFHLDVGSCSHAEQTAKIMLGLEGLMGLKRPDCVLVYGDTNSTLAASLVAAKMKIRLVHVEAGMRSFNKMPEEINRLVVDRISDLRLCSTYAAVDNLKREGIVTDVYHVGDVHYDATLMFTIAREVQQKRSILVTIHRPENTDNRERMKEILENLNEIGKKQTVVFPMHPRTRKMIEQFNLESLLGNIRVEKPQDYKNMGFMLTFAKLVITDSGGLQKEAYFHSVPCVTVRDETEWVETIDSGWNVLCGPNLKFKHPNKTHEIDDYGKGDAAQKICAILREWL